MKFHQNPNRRDRHSPSLLRKHHFLAIASILLATGIAVTYGKWEALTLLYGREFDNAKIVDEIDSQTGSMLYPPDYIKVIDYSEAEAVVLWVHKSKDIAGKYREYHIKAKFIKKRTESGKSKWHLETWCESTPENGFTQCPFPWYGGISN
jgi:hypothetical protein